MKLRKKIKFLNRFANMMEDYARRRGNKKFRAAAVRGRVSQLRRMRREAWYV